MKYSNLLIATAAAVTLAGCFSLPAGPAGPQGATGYTGAKGTVPPGTVVIVPAQ